MNVLSYCIKIKSYYPSGRESDGYWNISQWTKDYTLIGKDER